MYTGRLIFSQIMDHVPMHEFRRCVHRYQGNHRVKTFTCYDQYLSMAFAQLTFRESLRSTESCLLAQHSKLYHMGIRGGIARSTLADANEQRDWRIYADFAQVLIQVELFFKWIKQHLRIKSFFGTSENAVKTQVWIAISVLCAGCYHQETSQIGSQPLQYSTNFKCHYIRKNVIKSAACRF